MLLKYIIFSFLHSAVEAKAWFCVMSLHNAMHPEFSGKWLTEGLNTRLSLFTLSPYGIQREPEKNT